MTAASVFFYRLPQDEFLGIEFDSLCADGCHVLCASFSLSFGPKIILKAIFINQGRSEYKMGMTCLKGSGYLLEKIGLCLIGSGAYKCQGVLLCRYR
jgi:hypothetical protein